MPAYSLAASRQLRRSARGDAQAAPDGGFSGWRVGAADEQLVLGRLALGRRLIGEREVQDLITGTRTFLVAVGLPGYFWSVVAPCYMHLDSCIPHADGTPSAWYRRCGEDFPGALIPFGAEVISKPSPTKTEPAKPQPSGLCGIFLGYRFAPGGAWNGEYSRRRVDLLQDHGFDL
jgi:hypothetical protein